MTSAASAVPSSPGEPAIPRWLIATLVVALAFGLGYGIRRVVEDDAETNRDRDSRPVGVTFRQAAAVPLGTTSEALVRRFGGRPHLVRHERGRNLRCFVYPLSDRRETAWSFCFRNDRLYTSSTSPG